MQPAAENSLDSYSSPFQKPIFDLPGADFGNFLTIGFFLTFAIWLTFTVIAAYHWFRYGHRSWLAVPAIAVHLFISAVLILYMATGVR